MRATLTKSLRLATNAEAVPYPGSKGATGCGDESDPSSDSSDCTCGRCADGWFSPRMRFRLLWEAEMQSDIMSREQLDSSELVRGPGIEYLPAGMQEPDGGVSADIYAGYIVVVITAMRVLERRGVAGIPYTARVSATLAADEVAARKTTRFFAAGGLVAHALDFVVHTAMSISPLGNGTWDEIRRKDVAEAAEDGYYEGLRKCVNDLNFRQVEEKLGLPTRRSRLGAALTH